MSTVHGHTVDRPLRARWLLAAEALGAQMLRPEATGDAPPLRLVAEHAAAASDADFATIVQPRGPDIVVVTAVSGVAADGLLHKTAPLDGSLAGHVIRTGHPALVLHCGLGNDATVTTGLELGPLVVVPLGHEERLRGALILGRAARRPAFTYDDLDAAAAFAGQAAIALELSDLRAGDSGLDRFADHDRIAGDLHDHVIQELFAIGMGIQGLATVTDEPASVARLIGYVDGLDRVIRAIRTTIFQLQPHRHDSAGLQERVLDIAATHTPQLGYSPNVRFAGLLDLTVDEPLAGDVLAVLREGISNCARHAAATRLDISLTVDHERVVLEIIDNGRGLGGPARSSGLANMRRRAERHHGEFTVAAPDSGGTHLTWTAVARCPAPAR